MATQNHLNSPFPLAINKGGTAVTSVTTSPTASAWAGWDGNKNLSASSFINGYTTTVTSVSTVTLLVSSTWQQYFTGSTAQTVVLPATSTLVLGQSFFIVNNSSNTVTVQSSGLNNIQVMAASTSLLVTCILTSGSTASSWSAQYVIESALTLPLSLANGGTNANLTANNGGIFYSTASAGAILSGTATAGQALLSGESTTPAWSTSTYPATNAINTLLYASSANVMAALATANSGVLVTSSGGVPSISSTLPAFTTSSITFSPTTGGIVGTTTNDAAAAGKVGEFVSSQILYANRKSITNSVAFNVTSISLTAGDWDVEGCVSCQYDATTVITYLIGQISSTSANTSVDGGGFFWDGSVTGAGQMTFSISRSRFSLSTTTTIYLIAQAAFGVSTAEAYGIINARRVR